MNKNVIILSLLIGIIFISGCVSELPTGEITSSQETTSSQSKTEQINLSLIINSASDELEYISDPTVTMANNGKTTVKNLVYDVELYRDGKLITSETDVSYSSGLTYIRDISSGDSTKGTLNVMFYEGNTNDFTSGTYVLKVLVRIGANAKPIATAEKTVELATGVTSQTKIENIKEWHYVGTFEGDYHTKTESFEIKGKQWRIKYVAKPSFLEGGYFIFFVNTLNGTAIDYDSTPMTSPVELTKNIYTGENIFYISVVSDTSTWSMYIEDFY